MKTKRFIFVINAILISLWTLRVNGAGTNSMVCDADIEVTPIVTGTDSFALNVPVLRCDVTITLYNIYYQLTKQDNCLPVNEGITSVQYSGSTFVVIDQLLPYSEYLLTVEAISEENIIVQTVTISQVTSPAVPEIAPPSVHGMAQNSTLTFTWTEIPCLFRRGPITHYVYSVVAYVHVPAEPEPIPVYADGTLYSNITNITFNNLQPGTLYVFKVAAFNTAGMGPWSNAITISTPIGAPGPPRNLALIESRARSLTFSWDSPCDAHTQCTNNTYYNWEISVTDRTSAKNGVYRNGTTKELEVQLSNLVRCEQFTFTIRSGNEAGLSLPEQLTAATMAAPGDMKDVNITSNTATNMTVTWIPPAPCSATWYTVKYMLAVLDQCQSIEGTDDTIEEHLNGSATSITLYDLNPNSLYRATVYYGNSVGDGEPVSLEVVTAGSAPTGEPSNLIILDTGETSMVVSWDQPRCGERNGDIIGYQYIVRDIESETTHTSGNTSEPVLKVTGLSPYTNYRMRIAAINAFGQGPFASLTSTTTEGSPLAPLNVRILNSDLKSITIKWDPPPPFQGVVKKYEIGFVQMPSSVDISPKIFIDDPNTSSFRINFPSAGSTYMFFVRAVSSQGNVGPWSLGIEGTVEERVPGAPSDLDVSTRTENSLLIDWNLPRYPNGRIVSYTVEYRAYEKPYEEDFIPGSFVVRNVNARVEESSALLTNTKHETISLGDLEPTTKYEIRVTASTQVGRGTPVTILQFTDAASDIDPPGEPTIEGIGESTVEITVPLAESEYITAYLIAVRWLGQEQEESEDFKKRNAEDTGSSFGLDANSYVTAYLQKFDFDGNFVVGDNNEYNGYHNPALKEGHMYLVFAGSLSAVSESSSTLKWGEPVDVLVGEAIDTPVPWAGIIGGIVSFVVLLLLVIFVICWIRRKRKTSRDHLALPDIPERTDGSITELKLIGFGEKSGKLEDFDNLPSPRSPYDDTESPDNYYVTVEASPWDIPWTDLKLTGKIIGKGSFGEVQIGEVKKDGVWIKAAVKSLKPGTPESDKDSFKTEFDIMTKFGVHPNVVSVLGACDYDGTLYVALEFVPYGNLRILLRKFRDGDVKIIPEGLPSSLPPEQLLQFGLDVAKGMKHLAAAGVIHRDLAARNILVGEGLVAKVSDFGLSRGEEVYVQRSTQRVPTRWLAIESLISKTYSTKTDVWSFGIVLWEIVTFGGTPYTAIETRDITYRLRSGYRMPKPDHCEDDLYTIMLECWQENPDDRPTFVDLVGRLATMIGEKKIYVNTSVIRQHAPIRLDRDDN